MRTLLLSLAVLSSLALAEQITIDWERAKALHQRVSQGETLSPEDQKYYDEAKRQHDAGGNPGASPDSAEMTRAKDIFRRKQAGETISAEDDKFLAEMMRKHAGGGGGGAAPDEKEMQRARDIHQRKEAGQKLSRSEERR